jgi:glycosyltransferase involved in cell wall biosynthesis
LKSFEKLDNSVVIHNAFEGFEKEISAEIASRQDQPLRILLIGRINGWKGQDFAIESLVKMQSSPVLLRIVGSTSAGNEDLVLQLRKKVDNLGLSTQVEFLDFVSDTAEIYAWSDVVIVPSTKPEPFGRIAIEAMSLYKPVIAANHGGLPEIIEDSVSGYLFEPNNTTSFVNALTKYAEDRALLKQHGSNAKRSFDEKFSLNGFYKKLDSVFKNKPGNNEE